MAKARKKLIAELERAVERALSPGRIIYYREAYEFIEGLEAVRDQINDLVDAGRPHEAVTLIESFLAGCYEKVEEFDDSGGNLGMFVPELYCDWIRARQAAKTDATETADLLLEWMEIDDYGFCHGLEHAAVKVFDRKGLRAFEEAVLMLPDSEEPGSHWRRQKVEILKAIYRKSRNLKAFLTLCGDERTPMDCHAIAEICLQSRKPEEALEWTDRGIEIADQAQGSLRGGLNLRELRRRCLTRLGRKEEVLESVWEDYRSMPSEHNYSILMKFVPKDERKEWREKALGALRRADLASRINLLMKLREWTRLAALMKSCSRQNLMALSHYTTEPVAVKLEKQHGLLAAELRVAMALRIVEAKKSKYYGAALNHLAKARNLFMGAGQEKSWTELVGEIRSDHRRKYSFMAGFEELAESGQLQIEMSFLGQAKAKWQNRRTR